MQTIADINFTTKFWFGDSIATYANKEISLMNHVRDGNYLIQ